MKFKMKYLCLTLVVVLLISLLAACGGQTDEEDGYQTKAVSYDPNGFDPVESGESNADGESTEDGGESTENTEDDGDVDLPPIPI